MIIGKLEFNPIIDNKELVPTCIYDFVNDWENKEEQKQIIIGGGLVKSKISLPTELFLKLPNVEIVEGIAKTVN